MKIFVTGASGFIGLRVVRVLHAAGHSITALARSESSEAVLTAAGCSSIVRGTLSDLELLASAAREADAVIHLAFMSDFTDFADATETDRRAISAMGSAMLATNKPFIVSGGTLFLHSRGVVGTEDMQPDLARIGPIALRASTESLVREFATKGVRAVSVRLPQIVHDHGRGGFLERLVPASEKAGFAGYKGEGKNVWPAVHVDDAANLFRLALEPNASFPPGAALHPVAEQGVPTKRLAEAIGKALGIPVKSLTDQEAAEAYGVASFVMGVDNPVSSELTRKWLGWETKGLGLIEDVEKNTRRASL